MPLIATGPPIVAWYTCSAFGETCSAWADLADPTNMPGLIRGVISKQSVGLPRLLTSTIENPNDFTQSFLSGCIPWAGFSQSNTYGSRSLGTISAPVIASELVVVAVNPAVSVTISATS